MQSDTETLRRLDSFPYRHRVSEMMSVPVRQAPPDLSLAEASRIMADEGISSLLAVENEKALGIVTERDVLRAVAKDGADALTAPLSRIMSRPVQSVPADAYIYTALGRMDRLKLRHLLVVDSANRPVGMLTSRVLLRLRVRSALALGDEAALVTDPQGMLAVRAKLPVLASELLDEGLDGLGVCAVLTTVLRDITTRAAELAEQSLIADGWGPAPAPWCFLILGSGARGESFFAPDQDNAIIHAGTEKDDPWFAEIAKRISETLNAAGIVFCKGEVMAMHAKWRRSLEDWKQEANRWVRSADGAELLNVDIFLDFKPVYGDFSLAENLGVYIREKIASSPQFLRALAASVGDHQPALGFLGRFRTKEGRIEAKMAGLMPLVGAARLLALKHRIASPSTRERLEALGAGGHLPQSDVRTLITGHEVMVRALMRQQIADMDSGIKPTGRLDPRKLNPAERNQLRQALRAIKALHWILENALSSV